MRRALAPERYLLAVLVSTQRWVAPALVLIGLVAWIWVSPPIGRDTVSFTLFVLFALAAWLGYALGTCEEPNLELVSASSSGSATRMLAARWSLAFLLAAVVPLLLLSYTVVHDLIDPPQRGPAFTADQAVAAALALLALAVDASALGLVVSSLIPGRPGWAAGLLIILSLAEATPWLPPVRQLSAMIPDQKHPFDPIGLTAVLLAVGIGVALFVVARLTRRPVG